MSNLIKKISSIEKLYKGEGCTEEQIKEAQEVLKLHFPAEYIEYVKTFGSISFYGTEWTGLNVEEYENVVSVTLEERKLSKEFPKDCFVIENLGIDGRMVISDEKGCIFAFQYGKKEVLCENLEGYLDMCIARKKAKG